MTTAVIVQARMGSSRLPGKVMEEIQGRTVLAHVLERCGAIKACDTVVCAIPDADENKPLQSIARSCGADVFCGSEHDVLGRYLGAAKMVGADVVMRVTSDCPLIDPDICDAVLALRKGGHADYAANNMSRSFPHGLDCEAFTVAALVEADAATQDPYDREHVTPWLRRAAHLRRVNFASGQPSLEEHRWTLDYPEDLEFFRAVFAKLPEGSGGAMADVLKVISTHPEIADINTMRRQQAQ
jgi:spore coat polysaccharide biosynthesis protein SpsF